MSLGFSELILVVIAVVILFGGKKIPELARALGRAAYEFKKAKEAIEKEVNGIAESSENEVKEKSKPAVLSEKKEETGQHAG